MTYYEAECKIEVKPDSTKHPFNNVTLGFDRNPSYADVKRELGRRYPEYNLLEVKRVYDASLKAEYLSNYYKTKSFTGD